MALRPLLLCLGVAGCLGPGLEPPRASLPCPSRPVASARALLGDLGLPRLELDATEAAVRRQKARFSTEVCFASAVRAALSALATDGRDPDGALDFIRGRDHPVCARAEPPEIALCYLRREGAGLSLAAGTAASWRFAAHLPELSPLPFHLTVRRAPDASGRIVARSLGLFRSRARRGQRRCSDRAGGSLL